MSNIEQEANEPLPIVEGADDLLRIGITVGDVHGIGLEVILKTVADERICQMCTPVIYGSSKVVSYHKNIAQVENFNYHNCRNAQDVKGGVVNIVNCWQDNVNIKLGHVQDTGGRYALVSLERATADLKMGLIDALVTAPINKEAMKLANFPFPGHTEYLTQAMEMGDSLMLLLSDDLRVGLVTNHEPLANVAEKIKKDLVLRKISMFNDTLKIDFGIERPRIAVLGLNPHASDNGTIGKEDVDQVAPAIAQAKNDGILAVGPYPADGFFGSRQYKAFDGILAMYHDQGLIPFKLLAFGAGVNYTAGLPFVRTSPDHGTGFDIAGTNTADPSSFRTALFTAIDIVRHRDNYMDMHADPIHKRRILQGEDEDISALPDGF